MSRIWRLAIKSVTKGDDDWWQFEHNVAGKGRMKVIHVHDSEY
jgi:hypothetical protein